MIVELHDKVAGTVCFFVTCHACKREGPRVAPCGDADDSSHEAVEAAEAAGWLVHLESVRTPVRRLATGQYVAQYFCPACRDRAGTFPEPPLTSRKIGYPA